MPTGPIVPDTSAWVEFLRRTGSDVNVRLRELLREEAEIVVVGPVLMEVLSGARDERERRRLRGLFARYRYARLEDPGDLIDAARLYRACGSAGRTLGGHVDCLIAVVAMRIGAAVLHADGDFDTIAEHVPLRVA